MADLMFVVVILVFFALSVVLVRMCERIVGGGGVVTIDATEPGDAEVAA